MRCLIMGAPGAGKGTYADGIKKHFGIPHISTGEIFREAIASGSEMGLLAKKFIDKGNLVPDDVTNAIVKERLKKADCSDGITKTDTLTPLTLIPASLVAFSLLPTA